MDTSAQTTSNLGAIAKTITKILRFKRNVTSNTTTDFGSDLDDEIHKLKPSKIVKNHPQVISKVEDDNPRKEAMESLIANLFVSISAIKAAYAQLQVAQSPYDPETIQSSDQAVVSELKLLSQLKHSYFKNLIGRPPPPPMAAQVQEHRNLIKTYQITTKKLESDIQYKDSEIASLQAQLMESDCLNRSLEFRLHPDHLLSSLDGLHLSGLAPTHFLAAVRYANRSIRSFVKLMVGEMESAGWNLDAAAKSIQPDLQKKLGHRMFAFESFVCRGLFSDFHRQDFGLPHLEDRTSWEPQQYFTEFTASKSVKAKQILLNQKGRSPGYGEFCRAKYLAVVHPEMEASFFGDLDQRGLVSSGHGFPKSDFFAAFAELARRVWLLHCLFFSFGKEFGNSIFQVKRGCRFAEVYMASVLDERDLGGPVGFTVMPGFRIGKTVIQCKVYVLG